MKPDLNKAVREHQLKQKQHHDEGRVELQPFKLNEVALVGNQCHGVARWIDRRIYRVKVPHTYLVHCRNQVKFVHVDHLKKTA